MTDDLRKAWGRIGLTDDGKIARKLLLERLLRDGADSHETGAVNFDRGERSFARKLMELMDSLKDDGSDDDTDYRPRAGKPRTRYARAR